MFEIGKKRTTLIVVTRKRPTSTVTTTRTNYEQVNSEE